MSKEEMVQNLGTIARSGSKIFVEELAKMKKEETLNVVPEAIIGQVTILMWKVVTFNQQRLFYFFKNEVAFNANKTLLARKSVTFYVGKSFSIFLTKKYPVYWNIA